MGVTSGIPEASSRIFFWRAAACRWLRGHWVAFGAPASTTLHTAQYSGMCPECRCSRGDRILPRAHKLQYLLFVMGSVAGFGQKEKEIPSDRNGNEYCGVVKANLTRSPLRCRSDDRRAKLQRDSPTAGTRFLSEETLIGGWRAACFIGWPEWPAWLAAGPAVPPEP